MTSSRRCADYLNYDVYLSLLIVCSFFNRPACCGCQWRVNFYCRPFKLYRFCRPGGNRPISFPPPIPFARLVRRSSTSHVFFFIQQVRSIGPGLSRWIILRIIYVNITSRHIKRNRNMYLCIGLQYSRFTAVVMNTEVLLAVYHPQIIHAKLVFVYVVPH